MSVADRMRQVAQHHVLILSRICEAYDRGLSTEDAVAHGIRATADIVQRSHRDGRGTNVDALAGLF